VFTELLGTESSYLGGIVLAYITLGSFGSGFRNLAILGVGL
jgi:hypothetical protein